MKKILRNSVFRLLIIIAGNISMLVFLFTYIIPYRLSSPVTIAITIVMFLFFSVIFTLTMLCELCYDEGSKQLVVNADLDKANRWMSIMAKLDIFRWYRAQYCVFLTIYYRDTDDYEELEKILVDKSFSSNESMRLVYNYNQFLLQMQKGDDESVNKYYDIVINTYKDNRGAKNKGVALIYSLAIIEAEKSMFFRQYKTVISNLKSVQFGKLNKREQAYYYYLKYRATYLGGNKKGAKEYLNLAKTNYPYGKFLKEIGVKS